MLGNQPDLQMHVKILWGSLSKIGELNCIFWDGFQLDKTMPDAGKQDLTFYRYTP